MSFYTGKQSCKNNLPNYPKVIVMRSGEVVRVEKVSKIYGMGEYEITALNQVDLTICQGDYVSIMGPSGSGKTTLLDILTTMMKPTSGEVFIDGVAT
ncbi:MAG: ATP-binding cassette domain-containing protein, partial [Candidatus Diapherotrites archaeon]|nr:ATP-binding cassette domain-containing protein [Candidatus Diapherotrites archaeon]